MKKIIALLLALVMVFSMSTVAFVAFAEETGDTSTTTEPAGEESKNPFEGMTEEEIMDFIMGLDMHTVKFIFHVAKIGVKIAFVLDTLGFIDLSPIKNAILDAIWGLISDYIKQPGEEPSEPETTAATELAIA